ADSTTIANVQTALNGDTPVITPTTWCHTFNSNIGMGATGDDLQALEQALRKENIFPISQEYYGPFDEQLAGYVVKFQKKYGIMQTGYVGPLTRARLNSLYKCGITPTCTPNWTCGWGPCVNGWQSRTAIDSNNCGIYSSTAEANCSDLSHQQCSISTSITINSVSGPNSLNVGQTGTWAVSATAQSGSNLTYYVDWGDVVYPTGVGVGSANIKQTSTFTHSYSQAGTYTVRFKVTDNVVCKMAPCDNSAQTSLTVIVGGIAQCNYDFDCPSVCPACAAGPSASCAGQCTTYKCISNKCVANNQPSITISGATIATSYQPGQNISVTFRLMKSDGTPAESQNHFSVDAASYNANTNLKTAEGASTAISYNGNGYWTISRPAPKSTGSFYLRITAGCYYEGTCESGYVGWSSSAITEVKLPYLVVGTTQPSITVTSPNGGEHLEPGQLYNITWASTGVNNVMIELDKATPNTGWHLTYSVPASQGSFSFVIPSSGSTYPMGSDYKIAIWDTVNSSIRDTSDNYFSIVPGSTQPSITVTSPNGGEQWQIGGTHLINWSSSSVESVNIYLENWGNSGAGGPLTWLIAQNVSAVNGNYSWTIPSSIAPSITPGSLYKINIKQIRDIVPVSDSSNNYFTITSFSGSGLTQTQIQAILNLADSFGINYGALVNLQTALSGGNPPASGSSLTGSQFSAIIGLLNSFGANSNIISAVQNTLWSSNITTAQELSIANLLRSFGVNSITISNIQIVLSGGTTGYSSNNLTSSQIASIIGLLQSFGASQTIVTGVTNVLTLSSPSGLTSSQISAILGLLNSFGANSSIMNNVQLALNGAQCPGVGTGATPTSLTASQQQAITNLLQSFGANTLIIQGVQNAMNGGACGWG
ncbi:MAG: peptidoglycan-binding protein, partial [Candidatus Staskawiczbacteria bacterium]|nr:peptidoglycan-binding protein [Candidatus Staskawiczbacteria bacterium]